MNKERERAGSEKKEKGAARRAVYIYKSEETSARQPRVRDSRKFARMKSADAESSAGWKEKREGKRNTREASLSHGE